MKHAFFTLCFISLIAHATACNAEGTVVTTQAPTTSLSDACFPPKQGNPRQTAVYLPEDYMQSDTTTRYRVLYILHQWFSDFSELESQYKLILDDLIGTGTIEPLIAVMPDVSYFPYLFGFYSDFTLDGKPMNFESYIIDEVIPHIDANFNTKTDNVRDRAIAGYEWGGYGAVRLGTRHSDMFGAFSSFLGELDIQQILDAIFGFLLLEIPELQADCFIAPTQHVLFSPFNQNICRQSYFNELLWTFGASAAWSPGPLNPANPGSLPDTLNPLDINDMFLTIPPGASAPDADMSVNLPYDKQLDFINSVTTGWDVNSIFDITPNFTTSLQQQEIWVGYTNQTFDPFVGAPPFIMVDQQGSRKYADQLTDLNITFTERRFSGLLWVPSPSFFGFIQPTTYIPQIQEQLKFHDAVFNP